MTAAQKKLRELRDRQSKERGRMAELAIVDELTDETRAELDTIERGIPDVERQLRAAQIAVEAEEAEQRTAAPGDDDGDAEDRELQNLRSKVKLSGYVSAAVEQRSADGAEGEYNRHSPDDIQIRGRRTTDPPPWELRTLRSPPMRRLWRADQVRNAIWQSIPPSRRTSPIVFTSPLISSAYAGTGLGRRSLVSG